MLPVKVRESAPRAFAVRRQVQEFTTRLNTYLASAKTISGFDIVELNPSSVNEYFRSSDLKLQDSGDGY
jgi:hypothetical protein